MDKSSEEILLTGSVFYLSKPKYVNNNTLFVSFYLIARDDFFYIEKCCSLKLKVIRVLACDKVAEIADNICKEGILVSVKGIIPKNSNGKSIMASELFLPRENVENTRKRVIEINF